jgi:hypothetical protein
MWIGRGFDIVTARETKEIAQVDVKTIGAVQLLSDTVIINLDAENLLCLQIANPVSMGSEPCNEGNYDVSFARFVIKDAGKKLKIALPWGKEDASDAAAQLAFDCIMAKQLSGISICVQDVWKSYYFPCEYKEFIPAKAGEKFPWMGDYYIDGKTYSNGYMPNAKASVTCENDTIVLEFG